MQTRPSELLFPHHGGGCNAAIPYQHAFSSQASSLFFVFMR